jgi:hypothetical protein
MNWPGGRLAEAEVEFRTLRQVFPDFGELGLIHFSDSLILTGLARERNCYH